MPNDTLIKVIDVGSTYTDDTGAAAHALAHVSFDVMRGEFVSIVGPSGCGKSTLLRIIAGVQTPSKGVVLRSYKTVSMVFQNYALFPWLTVEENVAFGLHMHGAARDTQRHTVRTVLDDVGLTTHAMSYPAQLSGGQKQRVGIARALAMNPDLLLMDEPFSNLDAGTAASLKADVLKVWEKYHMTVVMVSHLTEDAVELSDRVVVMIGRPGTVSVIEPIRLPRPREVRSSAVHARADQLVRETAL